MRRTTMLMTATSVLMALSLGVPALADPPAPQIIDVAGDANFVNAQGVRGEVPTNGPDARPASIGGADFRSILFQTRYWTVRLYNNDGTLQKIDYRPMALQIDITTTEAIKPTFGPSLLFRVPVSINLCETWFQSWVKGAQPQAAEVERADIRKITATCPGAAATVFNGFQQTIDGNVMSLVFPFEAAAFTGPMAGFIKAGTQIAAPPIYLNQSSIPHVRTVHYTPTVPVAGSAGTFPLTIDETQMVPAFTVGSDVPADVICADTPDHPECAPSPIP